MLRHNMSQYILYLIYQKQQFFSMQLKRFWEIPGKRRLIFQ